MAAPRTETIVMREARFAARDDGLRVTIELVGGGVTRITMEPVASETESSSTSDPWDRAVGIAP